MGVGTTRKTLSISIHKRNDAIWDGLLILVPSLAVLGSAFGLVAAASMSQQDCHEAEIEEWQDMSETAASAIDKASDQISQVVQMTSHAPESAGEQITLSLLARSDLIRSRDEGNLSIAADAKLVKIRLSLSGLDQTSAVVLLVVGQTEHEICAGADAQIECSNKWRKLDWVTDQELSLQGVYRGSQKRAQQVQVQTNR